MKKLALCPEFFEFDFQKLKSKNAKVMTITNIPVKVDKILYDLTGETTIGVSGIMYIRGIKFRATWNSLGNILEYKSISVFSGHKIFEELYDVESSAFSLVTYKNVGDEED
ncbi:hypothetical protein FACS1894153_0560 [Bacteroidia bacterium]|nr:hypothetical protein FACS1894153_0560 [Bacteroidia bacterium]